MRKRSTIEKTFAYFLMGFFALSTLFPFYCMMVMGTHSNAGLFSGLKLWFGSSLAENFQRLLDSNFLRYFWNSLVIAVPATILTV